MINVNIKKMSSTAKSPYRGSSDAAGFDLFADISEPLIILSGESKMIDTGIAIEIPQGYFGGLYARSGLAAKKGLRPSNCVGIIDADYRGIVKVKLHNDSELDQTIQPQERIAQLIIQPYLEVILNEVEELSDTVRGEGGFGSTGK